MKVTSHRSINACMHSRLQTKYQNESDLISMYIIDKIIHPHSGINQIKINYQEVSLITSKKEYLRRFYKANETNSKRIALAEYYKYHHDYPYHMDTKIGISMMKYQEGRNKLERKIIKRLMNEPESITENSESQNSTDQETNCNRSKRKESDLYLKDLDTDKSSVILTEVCHEIDLALKNVKVNYFYRGIYDDGVKDFKKFMESRLTKKKVISPPKRCLKKEEKIDTQDKITEKKNDRNYVTKKIDSSRQLRKTFNSHAPSELDKVGKKEVMTFIRLKRNRTLTIKPQSFSKTTANDTVFKDEAFEPMIKKRNDSCVRIRKCKSGVKNLSRNKSLTNLVRMSDCSEKNKENEPKNFKPQNISHLFLKSREVRPLVKNKGQIKEFTMEKKGSEKNLTRKPSKQSLRKLQTGFSQNKTKEMEKNKTTENMIRSKLKLRA